MDLDQPDLLNQLTGTVDSRTFLKDYFQQQPLYTARANAAFYSSVLTTAELDSFLGKMDNIYPAIRMVKNGKELPTKDYTAQHVPVGNHRINNVVDNGKMFDLFNGGATLVIQAGQRYFTGLQRLSMALAAIFGAPVQANLYITPQKAQGFNPHWDTHEVLVLQVAGTKTWRMYGFGKNQPTTNQKFSAAKFTATDYNTLQLAPGDFLYVPRGYVHDAVSDNGISAHITLGILNPTWMKWINALLPLLEQDERFRKAMPFWQANTQEIVEEKREQLIEALRKMDLVKPYEHIQNSWPARQPQNGSYRFSSLLQLNDLENSRFKMNPLLHYQLTEKNGKMQLCFSSKQILLPGHTRSLLEFVSLGQEFTMAQLPRLLNTAGNTVFLSTLVREGFIHIIPHS